MSLTIALHSTQIPPTTSPHQEVIAIIDLTPERATELLALMNNVTQQAATSSTIFKISSFETSALLVPAYALQQLPSPNDFIILPPDYTVSAVTPVKLIHANVMPFFLSWSAQEINDLFTINTTELDAQVLKLIASGKTLPPGATSQSLKDTTRPTTATLISKENKYLH